jgi:hypothetical protein
VECACARTASSSFRWAAVAPAGYGVPNDGGRHGTWNDGSWSIPSGRR